ncbi:MAG: ATP-dependent DNA helicase RecG [Deinococcales bacterium]
MPTVEELRARLKKPLERELAMGCENKVVTAGLEALLQNVAQPFPQVRAVLDGYSTFSLSERKERLLEALALLESGKKPPAKPQKELPTEPSSLHLDSPLEKLALPYGAVKKLATLDVRNPRDLLHFYPRRYEDRRKLPGFHVIADGAKVTIVGTVVAKSRMQPRKGMLILKAEMRDDLGNSAAVTWFNQPWIEKTLREGARLIVTGKAKRFGRKLEIAAEYFELDDDSESLSTDRIIGVYSTTDGISQAFLRRCTAAALAAFPELEDYLSSKTRGEFKLMPLAQALREAHQPSELELLEKALERLKFDEFLFLELRVLLEGKSHLIGKQFRAAEADMARFEATLPFRFTNAQRRALLEIADSMRRPQQMARLLQGDVGSGKTAVAACALYLATRDGFQGALMAPTEILARQHYLNFQKYLFPLGVKLELLIGAMTVRERRAARARLESGEIDIAVGTQALIQEGVVFKNLGLAVIDEEHRFGVMQRRALLASRPDVLVMSATPIPRSLALTAYGDLELTVIDELPPGRTPIQTKLLLDTHRRQAYSFVLQQIRLGRQAYVVAPLIEESEKLEEILAATQLAADLRELLPEAKIELLHGKMPPEQKDEIMGRFRAQEFDILVSTTVIEVGVDVPNATVIVIENAERFGLSQLHQLRGRVGRGQLDSYCLLVAGDHSKKTKERLKVIESSTDGFKIAEADLKLRGPGEIMGTRQSGLPDLKLGDIARDTEMIEQARILAKRILEFDPTLEKPASSHIRQELQARNQGFVKDVI